MKKHPRQHAKDQKRILVDQLTGLVSDLTVLKELRSSRVSNAIEFLEFSMDCKLSVIGNTLSAVAPSTRKLAFSILKQVKDFRTQHPRKVKIGLLKTKDFDVGELTAEAARTLKSVPE